MASPVIVGYSVKVRSPKTVRNHLTVSPPGALKKPESIEAWKQDPEKQKQAWARLDRLAPWMKLTGTIDRVVALDVKRQELFDSDNNPQTGYAAAGARFVTWLGSKHNFPSFPGGWGLEADYPVRFYGFNPKPLIRLACQDTIRAGGRPHPGMWYKVREDYMLDPKQMLLETEVKQDYPLAKICEEAPAGPIPLNAGYQPHLDPLEDLRLAVELCVSYCLIPLAWSNPLSEVLARWLAQEEQEEAEEQEPAAEAGAAEESEEPEAAVE